MLDAQKENELMKIFKKISKTCSILVGVIAILVLIGWVFNIGVLKSFVPGFFAMKVNSAIMFLLTSITLIMLQNVENKSYLYVSKCLSLIICLVGLLTLAEYIFNVNLYIDQLLFTDMSGPTAPYPGRIAPYTCVAFISIGVVIFLSGIKQTIFLAQILAILIGLFGILSLLDFAYGTVIHIPIENYIRSSFFAQINFILIALAVLFLRPNRGLTQFLASDTDSAYIIRRIFPLIITIPIIFGYLISFGQINNLYDFDLALSSDITGVIGIIIFFVFFTLRMMVKVDIKRLEAERQLRDSEYRWKYALEGGNQGVWDWNIITNHVFYSPSWKRILGYSIDQDFHDLDVYKSRIHPDDLEKTMLALNAHIAGKTPDYISEHRMRSADGQYRWILDRGKVVEYNSRNEPTRAIGTMTDIHKIKETENKLQQISEKLERSNTDLQQFAYVASHDLREPLRTIESYTQLLQRRYSDKFDADGLDFMHYITDGVVRMQHLIDDLLIYSRVTTKAKPLIIVDANKILEQVLFDLQTRIKEKNAKITFDALPQVKADELQLAQVFQNLLTNAIKFCDKEPEIHIGMKEEADCWLFYVKDNGIGIDPQYFNRIFNIFQRLNPSNKYPGTGIGLATCKKIIERHGGKIWVESGKGQGSTFYFTVLK